MKSIIFLITLILSINASSKIELKCHKIINGNVNKEAMIVPEKISASVTIDLDKKRVVVEGEVIAAKNSIELEQGDRADLEGLFFKIRKVKHSGDKLFIHSYVHKRLFCLTYGGACRVWDFLAFDKRKKEIYFENSESTSMFGKNKHYLYSFRLKCN